MPAIAILDFTQDVLSGLNVREYNYVDLFDLTPVEEMIAEQDAETELVLVPFAVLIYNDGQDYDENGYFHECPSDILVSSHCTRRGAEIEAAHIEHSGTEQWRISIIENYGAYRYELRATLSSDA
jgi:hypothetical protein